MRKLFLLVSVIAGSLLFAPSAQAAINDVFGGAVTCTPNPTDGVRECGTGSSSGDTVRSTAPSWDGTPIDVNVAFPPASEGDGPFPLIIVGHGYGGEKVDFGDPDTTDGLRRFTSRGYAVFAMTARGFHQSCGKANAISAASGACDDAGWIHLMDDRFEIRDAQFLMGELADEGVADGQRVGAIGGSYGGGLSLQLATLKDRTMMPDGSLVPWTSPVNHLPMRIAGATPNVPWSDLAYSLTPNGQKLDYVADAPYAGRIGVQKQSFVGGLYASGQATGAYCAQTPLYPSPCPDFESDIAAWNNRLNQGEPYDGDQLTTAVFNEIEMHHSAYYIDHSTPPAPLLISNGFTDDLFPADEAITYFNRIRSQYPNAPISMLFGDFGHPRAADKDSDTSALNAAENAWLDFYVKGTGPQPFQGVTTFAPTCPVDPDVDSLGPYQAGSWAGLQKGEVRLDSAGAKVIQPGGGSADVDKAFDPISAGQNPCTTASSADLPGVATYRLPAATGSGFTLMGSPTVVAKIDSPVANSEVAARLLDVDPGGSETLVDRQLLRPLVGSARQVFQLHPTGHLFAPGHVAKLELLPSDSHGAVIGGYGRAANGQGQVTISDLSLRLPTLDGPGAGGGAVKSASPLALPCGAAIAPQFSSSAYVRATLGSGKVKRKGRTLKVPVNSAPSGSSCQVSVKVIGKRAKAKKKGKRSAGEAKKKHKKKKSKRVLGKGKATIAGGQSKVVKVKLSKSSARALPGKVRLQITTIDAAGNTVQNAKVKVVAKKPKKHKKHKR
jgi:predicted acyl esterase